MKSMNKEQLKEIQCIIERATELGILNKMHPNLLLGE